MKKRECAIVQDLLVLYEDGVLQEESMQMVEEHIRGCEECMKIYENAGKEVPVSGDDSECSEAEQEDAAARVMKRIKKHATRRNMMILSIILTVMVVAAVIAQAVCLHVSDDYWGIVDMIYRIPEDKIEVTQIYQLKNGDIYCELESDRKIGIQSCSDWIIPDGEMLKNTENAEVEISFRQVTPWEDWNTPETYRVSAIFSTKRQGTEDISGDEVVQYCREIRYRGRTKEDSLIIWERGQEVEEAPEEIEKKVIVEYIRNGKTEKAIQECRNMRWDGDEIVEEFYKEASQGYCGYGDQTEAVTFPYDFETILFNEW